MGLKDAGLVGGKAASLGEMIKAGVNVPPGFVILAKVHTRGMTPQLAKEIVEAFDQRGLKRVAVRSSAIAEDSSAASWAGQLETYLNVTRDGLVEAVKKCWASIGSEHAQAYGSHHGVSQAEQAVAVVVQAMVDSDVSGVMFTVNPVTNDKNEIVIESVYGLGELIVQGAVTPENVVINKNDGSTIAHSPGRQQKMLVYKNGKNQEIAVPKAKLGQSNLKPGQISELNRVAKRIEHHYGHPQDIEWAIEGNKLYIVQSRPITTFIEAEETPTFTFEKLFTREESLMVSEIQYTEFVKWLAQITPDFIPPLACRIRRGLLETWLCRESTQKYVDDIYRHNSNGKDYLEQNIKQYKELVAKMAKFERHDAAKTLPELKEYLDLFGQIMIPLHVIFFTPFREDTPKPLFDLAMKVRGEDAVFDTSDLYIRDSLACIYPECNGIETLIGLKDLDGPDPKKLKTRENNFVWAEKRYLSMDFDTFQEKYPAYNFLIDEVDPSQKVITGTIAFKGRVKGEAQVITRKKDVAGFKDGNVLVAPMTTPHYLPAMKKAKAFVTDEGGVTCHAAIVSRELKTPCIIGTKIATEVLSNGDLVEVDANNGKVIIKNKA